MVRTKDLAAAGRMRIGVLTPFVARAGSSWYANQLKRCFPEGNLVVLGEDHPEPAPAALRCWQRANKDFSRLEQTIANESIKILHIIGFRPFFETNAFLKFLRQQKARGVRVLFDVFDAVLAERDTLRICQEADAILLAHEQQAVELSALGFPLSKTRVVSRGDLQLSPVRLSAGTKHSLNVLALSDGSPSQELERLVSAVAGLRAKGLALKLEIVALENVVRAGGTGYGRNYLSDLSTRYAATDWLLTRDQRVGCDELVKAVEQATCLALVGSPHSFESEQAISLAFSLRCPVVAEPHARLLEHGNRIAFTSESLSLAQLLDGVHRNEELRKLLVTRAGEWIERHSLNYFVDQLVALYLALEEGKLLDTSVPSPESTQGLASELSTPRILMQCRPNAFSQPGGDTVVLERLSAELRSRGLTVDIDQNASKNPRDYDLVHLFNFALRDQTLALAKTCQQLNVPYVVTTLYEDWPMFFNQMQAHCSALEKYVAGGQNPATWSALLKEAKSAKPSPIWDNSLTANSAAALIATGDSEARALARDYPSAKNIEICPLAPNFMNAGDGGDLFRRQTGLSDFVLCVGRFELRKNQLMLLKALEDSELTVVFAGGGFSYQPVYAELCRKFRRKGRTVFLDRLEPEVLASAFQAARVHALAGWLELPGLVSLEAALFGTNVVVSDFGTARDYLGEDAFYCDPADPASIANAVNAGFYAPVKASLKSRVGEFTWKRSASCLGGIYQRILESRGDYDWSFVEDLQDQTSRRDLGAEKDIRQASVKAEAAGRSVGLIPVLVGEVSDGPQKTSEAKRICDEGDVLAKSGEMPEAKQKYAYAVRIAPHFARGHRGLGAMAIAEGNYREAATCFEKAIELEQEDSKGFIGLATAKWELGAKDEAFSLYLGAAKKNPSDKLAILHLVRTAYAMNRLKELEQALRAFLKTDADNLNILYCLAGCSYRRGRFTLALGVLERILRISPEHEHALELRQQIRNEQQTNRRGAGKGIDVDAKQTSTSSDIDEAIRQLEITKRNREHDLILRETEQILANRSIQPQQRARAQAFQAEALACTGELAEADRIFKQIEDNPELSARAIAGRGAIIAASGDFNKAKEFFTRALASNATYDVALAGLGLVATQEGQAEEAWNYFQRALQSNPENLRALYGIIQLGYSLQRLPETAKALETYLDLRPVDLAMNYSFAGCCFALGQKERAVEELRKILLFEPKHELALELLAKIEGEDSQKLAHAG